MAELGPEPGFPGGYPGGLPGGFPGGFAGGFPGGFAGFPGFGKSLNVDISGGVGAPGIGAPGVGIPGFSVPGIGGYPGGAGFAGWGGPYVPTTPLGALGGIKGDLLVPIVVVGVAAFILLIIVLAVKAALAFKVKLLGEAAGVAGRHGRSEGTDTEDTMMEMTQTVMRALNSNCWDNTLLCGMGKMIHKRQEYLPYFKVLSTIMPESMMPTFNILKTSAEKDEPCEVMFPCQLMHDDAKNLNTTHFGNEEHSNFLNSTSGKNPNAL